MIALFILAAAVGIAALAAWRLTRGDAPVPRLAAMLVTAIVVLAGLGAIFTARSH